MRLSFTILSMAWMLAACAGDSHAVKPSTYQRSTVIPPSPFHGVHGLAVAEDGAVMGGSVVGQAIYRVDPANGEVRTLIGPPEGMADDIAFGPGGVMAWTGFLTGTVYIMKPGGAPQLVASGLPGANSLDFTSTGRLYMTRVFLGDALYEIDWSGGTGARLIREGFGGLNGFEIGRDGMIYGPLWFKGQVVRVNPDDGAVEVLAEGFEMPAAVNFAADGKSLYVIDTHTGQLFQVDLRDGSKTAIVQLPAALDNLAVAPDGTLYISNMADATIYEVKPETGDVRKIVSGHLAIPADIAAISDNGKTTLHVADLFAYRTIDVETGEIADPLRMYRDEMENPIGIGVGEKWVLLTGWSTGTVQLVDRKTGVSKKLLHGFQGPSDAIEQPGGSVLVLETLSGRLVALDPNVEGHSDQEPSVFASGLEMPVAMVRAADGTLYVTERDAGTIAMIGTNGAVSRLGVSLSGPEGIDILPDGRLVVVEVDAKQVSLVDPASNAISVIATDLPVGLPPVPGTPVAYITSGVAVDPANGDIFVSSDLTNEIIRLSPKRRFGL